jgi:alpha-tubulin suppressor-like RCC1 family protein
MMPHIVENHLPGSAALPLSLSLLSGSSMPVISLISGAWYGSNGVSTISLPGAPPHAPIPTVNAETFANEPTSARIFIGLEATIDPVRLGLIGLVFAAACGRIGFDVGGGNGDGSVDAYAGPTCTSLAAGRFHSCAVDAKGGVWCWGDNSVQQANPASFGHTFVPTRIALARPAVEVVAGTDFSCARLDDGTAWCWGDGAEGALGDGTAGASGPGPTRVSLGAERATHISAGPDSACIERASDGGLMCWGDNSTMGLPLTANPVLVPTLITGLGGATGLRPALGHRHGCVSDDAGEVLCWGLQNAGRLGDNGPDRTTPTLLNNLAPVDRVVAGGSFTCVVERAGGAVRCFGANTVGQLGRGNFMDDSEPGAAAATNAVDVGVGAKSACALGADGVVTCWGSSANGEAAGGNLATRTTGAIAIDRVLRMASAWHHTCVVRGVDVLCWGLDLEGELGRGTRNIAMSPTPVTVGAARVTSIGLGYGHGCALDANGAMWCWGANTNGQLGDGTLDGRATPIAIEPGFGAAVAGISVGHATTCAWSGGLARCWGQGTYGQLGNNASPDRQSTAVAVSGLTSVTAMAVGLSHTCAISGGTVYCWGSNYFGQLGLGALSDTFVPMSVTLAGPTQIAAGGNHTCAIAGGALSCWGLNYDGQIGNGNRVDQHTPITIALVAQPVEIDLGDDHTCALLASGAVYCWGINTSGELGVGDFNTHFTPTLVTLPANAVHITAAEGGTCAGLVNGDMYCWGTGNYGELGNGATSGSENPVRVSLANVDVIARGGHATCASNAGGMYCWGSDRTAQLGTGLSLPSASPGVVPITCNP